MPPPSLEHREINFADFQEWSAWVDINPGYFDNANNVEFALQCARNGITEPVINRFFGAGEITWNEANLRESGYAGNIISRNRAVHLALESCLDRVSQHNTKIYGTEAITSTASLLRGFFLGFIGSEYTSDPAVKDALYPIPVEDLISLTLKNDAFDAVITTEVLEHVPPLGTALSEIHRVLRPSGWHVGTCPFMYMQQDSVLKTTIEDGKLIHLMEPEYHGDPMGTGGTLVFEILAWDILDRARNLGFLNRFWKWVRSPQHDIVTNGCGGVFVLCLQR